MKREKILRVRFNDTEWARLSSLCADTGMDMSSLVRDYLGKVSVRNRKDERERTIALNRINANLNMIAKWVNTHKGSADAVQVLTQLATIEQLIKVYK